jgi:hypothetical protein
MASFSFVVAAAIAIAPMNAQFDCSTYESTCSGIAGYEAYQNCAATIAVNDASAMACRIEHLAYAALAPSNATTHCPHAAPNAAVPCATEMLATFDCAAYVSRCSGETGYEAYPDCAATVAANDANAMACRIQHLAAAASNATLHCPHAAPNAAAPCATEMLATATAPTSAPTAGDASTPAPTSTNSSGNGGATTAADASTAARKATSLVGAMAALMGVVLAA